jgi:hypothetical protein
MGSDAEVGNVVLARMTVDFTVRKGIGKPTRLMHVGGLLPFTSLSNQRYGGLAQTLIVHNL